MKNIFKAIIILIFTLFIPMQTVKASTYTEMGPKNDVPVSKMWTVNCNKILNSSTVNTENVKVIGEDNNYIDINVGLANNNKSITVKPVQNYQANKTYTLIVTEGVKSADGNPLSKEVRMTFTTKKTYKIVLDAGHGGYDSGAVGPTGIMEKNVTLAITLKIGTILAKNGVETIYTRTTDEVDWSTNEAKNLQARCDISNKANPDYFVSIHANSATASAIGIETYYYAGNASGAKLAQDVQTELIKATGKSDRGIKTANFYVLKNLDATAILVETSFISNPIEEKLLASDDYQNKLAKAISTAILNNLGISNIVF